MNPSTALATVIVNALVELGVRQVVLCPGSRSAPLAYALAQAAGQHRLRLYVRIDERSAGFLALGLSKAGLTEARPTEVVRTQAGVPSAVITTSGTAVANLHPAILEAAHSGVPLLVISADRPHELRGVGASQTTDQVKLFGDAVRWFAELPAPVRAVGAVALWRNVVARAVSAASGTPGGRPGPVHLNVAFADPLIPQAAVDWPEPLDGRLGAAGLTRVGAGANPSPVTLPRGPLTVVVAGDGAGPAAALLAASAGWPLLAEPSSGSRTLGAIGPYRLLLDVPELSGRIERVVVHGRPTLSRPVTRLLSRDDVELIVVSTRPDWSDAGRRAALVVPAVAASPSDPADPADLEDQGWLRAWQRAGEAARRTIDRVLDDEAAAGRLSGALIAREVAAATMPGDVLFAGSSNPIRDLDLAAAPFDPAASVLANRGLAGIDGTLSSASGVALARAGTDSPGQVRALVGDLTLLHDVGALLIGRLEERPNLQIIVLDDDGGGIFGLLEHGARAQLGASQKAVFERVFGTPQQFELDSLCAGFSVDYDLIHDVETLRKALATPPPGTSILHLKISRGEEPRLAAHLRAAVQAGASSGGAEGFADG